MERRRSKTTTTTTSISLQSMSSNINHGDDLCVSTWGYHQWREPSFIHSFVDQYHLDWRDEVNDLSVVSSLSQTIEHDRCQLLFDVSSEEISSRLSFLLYPLTSDHLILSLCPSQSMSNLEQRRSQVTIAEQRASTKETLMPSESVGLNVSYSPSLFLSLFFSNQSTRLLWLFTYSLIRMCLINFSLNMHR